MKNMTLGIGLLVGVLLAVSSAEAVGPALMAQAHHGHEAVPEKTGHKTAHDEEADIKLQTTCPVMGGKIDKTLFVDHDGRRVYICCKGCEKPLKKDPGKYIKAMEADGITVAKIQTTCPVMGGKIDKKLYVDHDGKRIYVCCDGCVAKVGKDPAKYIKSMEKAGVALHTAGESGKAAKSKKPAADHEGHRQ